MGWKNIMTCLTVVTALVFSGCGSDANGQDTDTGQSQNVEETPSVESALEQIDMSSWQYNEEDDAYWQVGIAYCSNPADSSYENLGIFVPGAYMTASDNGDGTYTCEINTEAEVGEYTAETAPIVIPVETPGYSAMSAPTDYVSSTAAYTSAGFVYVYPGCRGRDAGAPAGVTDLKAAIRYIRYNEGIIPGNTENIFSFGMSGGGAQSALLGATGDSELYTPYLEAIGAVSGVSDAVAGSMCWCPITNLDYASEAYEWNLGVTRSELSEDMQELSDSMAEQFALYINELGLKDGDGNILLLEASENGIYQAGSYYEYLKTVVETSLNHFLSDTEFPYDASSSSMKGGRGGNIGERDGNMGDFDVSDGELPDGELPDGELPDGELPDGELPDRDFGKGKGTGGGRGGKMDMDESEAAADEEAQYAADGIDRMETSGGISLSGTYETAEDYIAALNAETEWVNYDTSTNTATITGIADFVNALKHSSKNLGAFDDLDESQGENILFGDGDGEGDHFDSTMASLLEGTEYEDAYAEDMERTDALGNSVEYRVNMYNPLYYLCDYYEGVGSSEVAKYWRIRSGINQSDTALTTEVNLALALENNGAAVDFETVWGQGHVEAERTGDSTTNFIDWVNECLQSEGNLS